MTHHESIRSAESEWARASGEAMRLARRFGVIGAAAAPIEAVLVVLLADALVSGAWRYVIVGVVQLLVTVPMAMMMAQESVKQQRRSQELALDLERQLTEAVEAAEREAERRAAQVRRQDFETRFANALEMAQDEAEVLGAVERALAATLPDHPAELLLADNSHAHLTRMAVSAATGEVPACPVDSPDHCPAARRAQVQQFSDSEALDACPKLRDRARGRCSAVCVPVSVMGRTVGVIHAIGEPGAVVKETTVADLSTLSKLAGARIGLLRVMAETQLQAATDSLTGLLNRRSLENRVRILRAAHTPFVVAMADLDHFKELNDTHGHETGDRALRLFAHVLRSSLRADDIVARYGGEEFAVVMPGCSLEAAHTVLDQARLAVESSAAAAGLPPFTVSFGVVDAGDGFEDLSTVLARADAALFEAKREGRNRVIVHGAHGQAVSPPEPTPTSDNGRSSRRKAARVTPDVIGSDVGNDGGGEGARELAATHVPTP